jgi:4-hydroxy-3-methylbut-2-enyl diphosphate reductase
MGVRRAVDMAGKKFPAKAYTLGPLIHNPQALASLREQGLTAIDDDNLPACLEGATVIIRAHGVSPLLEAELVKRGALLEDATCPRVKMSQMKARSLEAEGRALFLAGEKHHGEIIGIQGYAPSCLLVADRAEAEKTASELFRKSPHVKTALIGQSTISREEYQSIGKGIQKFFPALEIVDTICAATRDRQDSLRELCAKVDAVIVAGGRASANTRRLLAIAKDQGKPAWLVEEAAFLPPEIARYNTAGLCAGASTPDTVIDEIEQALSALRPIAANE